MTWLYSLYWLGALAVAGPVLFHMWRRMPRGERRFSTLMFLSPSPPRITSRSRIEHWLLMLLRAAALALLAFAFTRPLWRTPITEPDDPSSEQLVAVVVDTSASMRRTGVWSDLVQQLDDRLAKLPPQTTVALYHFDKQFASIADFSELRRLEPTARRELVRARLKELKPTWFDTQLGEALVRTATAVQEAQTERSKPAGQRIWLATDLQSGADIVPLQGYEWPDDLPVELVPARPASPSNAGLQVVDRNPESDDDQLRVRITNAPDSKKEQFTLRWDVRESPATAVYVPPGQSRILTPPKLPAGVASSTLVLAGDDDDFDNRVYVAETAPERRLVIYCGPEPSNDTEGARFYLDRVFSASHQYVIELKERQEVNTASADSQPSLIVLVQPDANAETLVRNHLANGGTILIAAPTAETMSACIAMCGRTGLQVSEANVPKYAMLAEVDFEHPIFVPFAESQFSDFTGIRFWKHRTITGLKLGKGLSEGKASGDGEPKSGGPATNDNPATDRVLARFDNSDPAIVEFAAQRGRVIVFAAGWQPADSQFARSSKFPMLMFRLLEQSTSIVTRPGTQSVGSSIAWPVASRLETAATGTVRFPDGTEIESQSVEEPFSQTDSPGLYTLSIPGRSEQVAVNLSADESRTAPMTLEQLETYGMKLKSRERPQDQQRERDRQRQLQLAELEQSQKLWQQILLAVIVVLLLETVLTGLFRSKSLTGDETPPVAT